MAHHLQHQPEHDPENTREYGEDRATSTPEETPGAGSSLATMRTMTEREIDAFVSTQGFGILSLADANHAYGAPLFYGTREGAIYFQTRAGMKTHYLYSTTEACLTISSTRGMGEWASVQLIGRLERMEALSAKSVARSAVLGVPPPLLWADGDVREDESRTEGVTTFRLVPLRRVGRYSQPAILGNTERLIGF